MGHVCMSQSRCHCDDNLYSLGTMFRPGWCGASFAPVTFLIEAISVSSSQLGPSLVVSPFNLWNTRLPLSTPFVHILTLQTGCCLTNSRNSLGLSHLCHSSMDAPSVCMHTLPLPF